MTKFKCNDEHLHTLIRKAVNDDGIVRFLGWFCVYCYMPSEFFHTNSD